MQALNLENRFAVCKPSLQESREGLCCSLEKAVALIVFCLLIVVSTQVEAERFDTFETLNKNRVKQLSQTSKCANFYEKKNGLIKRGSKDLGLKVSKKCRGTVRNYVSIKNSKVGNVTVSAAKRLKNINPFSKKNKEPDRNLGVMATDCRKRKKIENLVIVQNSKIENAVLGARVNSGILMSGCKGQIIGKTINNNVEISKGSRVGGAMGLVR